MHCLKSVRIRSFFWSVFSHIRTECGVIRSISPYSVQMQKIADQKNSEYGHFSRSNEQDSLRTIFDEKFSFKSQAFSTFFADFRRRGKGSNSRSFSMQNGILKNSFLKFFHLNGLLLANILIIVARITKILKALREKCPKTEFVLVRIFLYSD